MHYSKLIKRFVSLTFLLSFLLFNHALASDIVSISPITKNILLVVFDDGSVSYPNDLQVDRLLISDASELSNYSISSADDSDFTGGLNPVDIGRKSMGTAFVKNPPWGGNSYDPRSKPWASEHFIYLFLDKELKSGSTYTLNTSDLAKNGSDWVFTFDERELRSEAIHVNTVGYETNAPKYAYVYQWMGDKGGLDLTAYAGNSFSVYKEGVSEAVLSGVMNFRKSASNDETSQATDTPDKNFLGAEVYECDFSDLSEDGTYTLAVEGIGCSYPFKIGRDALWDAYYKVGRALFYQRSGIRLAAPYTDAGYLRPVNQNTLVSSDDGTDFSGLLLYSDVPYAQWTGEDGGSAKQAIKDAAIGNPLDVAGWYHDAGDWDGYYSHQRIPILLMLTYEYAPERFADGDLNLPESGNGIPDLLDEASWLIKFNYRLRKELMAKGYSDGGVGGSRVCPDVFSDEDGNAQSDKPSWKDHRRYVVSAADAYMTYLYAGQAAQFAVILRKLGKDPTVFPVEMLDNVDFALMTRDTVNWEQEAREAYAWASDPDNRPSSGANYSSPLEVYKMYAAANLFRLTNETQYNADALDELEAFRHASKLGEDERFGVYAYLLADNYTRDVQMISDLTEVARANANARGVDASKRRATRWGGVFDMPMLIGQGTTPWVFECIVAYGLTGEKEFADVAHTTADYFLGTNPRHTTWATGLGPRPPIAGFHLDSRYNNNWVLYPGFIPYGPWSMNFDYNPYTWTIDGVVYQGGHGPWNKDWANFSQYPFMELWPGHERWNNNIHAPMSSENTVHQNAVFGALTYGFVNNRHNSNSTALRSVASIALNKSERTFTYQGETDTLKAVLDINDAGFGQLKWESSDENVAHVDGQGRVTANSQGTCTISVSTLDGSVSASCEVTCGWVIVNVESISIRPDTLSLLNGERYQLQVFFSPENASNKQVEWSLASSGILEIDAFGKLRALNPGEEIVIATSSDGGKKDSCYVTVAEVEDFIIADFDTVIPVLSTPQPDVAQLYTPAGGSSNIAASNPLPSLSNASSKVVKYNRPTGTWKLIGMVLPTDNYQPTDSYAQFQFKYFGSGIAEFYVQLISEAGDAFVSRLAVNGEEAWKLYAIELNESYNLKQFNVFVNPEDAAGFSCYLDDFKVSVEPAVWFDGTTLSADVLEMKSGTDTLLSVETEGNAYSIYSQDSDIATVDQDGNIHAVAKGSTKVRVVPLYGIPRECVVNVDSHVIEATGISIEGASAVTLELGSSLQLNATIQPEDATEKQISWESGNDAIVSVSSEGLLRAVSVGTATIKAAAVSNPGIFSSITVTVEDHSVVDVSGIEIEGESSLEIRIDSIVQLHARISPENASSKEVTWSTSAPGIAAVTNEGLLRGVEVGSADITVSSVSNSDIKASISVLVYKDLGLEVKALQGLLCYPNPVNDRFTVSSSMQMQELKLIALSGETVLAVLADGSCELSVEKGDLLPGMYILKVTLTNSLQLYAKVYIR